MKITVLFENTLGHKVGDKPVKEGHGLSLYIEFNGRKILFDVGQGEAFSENAEALGINLSEVDTAVISHGHYDHGGGLPHFLTLNNKAKIYISKNAFGSFYSGKEKYIGLAEGLDCNKRLILTDPTNKNCQLGMGIYLTCLDTDDLKYPMQNQNMLIKTENGFVADSFDHEQYLVIEEKGRKILFSGCSHKGILNIAKNIKADVIIGGFHFSKLSTDEFGKKSIEEYAEALLELNTVFYTCHCTGTAQYEIMKNIMKDRLFYIGTGDRLELL